MKKNIKNTYIFQTLLRLKAEVEKELHEGTFALLMCLCSADLACDSAYEFAKVMERISGDSDYKDNAFTQALAEKAKEFERLVTKIDTYGNEALSMFYASMAEEANRAAREAMQKVIDKWRDTDEGRKYF